MNHNNSLMHSVNTVMMWLFCLTVLMLIVPWEQVSENFAQKIQDNRLFLYFALIIEISNLISQAILTIYNSYAQKSYQKRRQETVLNTVGQLDFAEKALLREYVLQRKSVLNLPVSEPTVRNLIDGGVLKIVSVIDAEKKLASVIISKEARPHITYKAIGLTLGRMSEEQISTIMSARPEYAREKIVQQNRVIVGSKAINTLFKSPKSDLNKMEESFEKNADDNDNNVAA